MTYLFFYKEEVDDYLGVCILNLQFFQQKKTKIKRMKYVWDLSQHALTFVLESFNGYAWSWFYQKINSFTSTKFWLFVG